MAGFYRRGRRPAMFLSGRKFFREKSGWPIDKNRVQLTLPAREPKMNRLL
jgi:hypothetical protein